MKTLIRANKLFQEIQSIDKEIKTLETDLKNVINDDLTTHLDYTIKNKPKKEDILDEDGSLKEMSISDGTSWTTIFLSKGSGVENSSVKNEESFKKLNPSEFVVMFGALLTYKQELRKKLVDDFKKLETKIKL